MNFPRRIPPQKGKLHSERAIQLRREAVAAMKLRSPAIPRCVTGARKLTNVAAANSNVRTTRILAISDYEGLRTSREELLQRAGFHVESVPGNVRLDGSWVETFDLAILCQSIDPSRVSKITQSLRRANPNILIVRINPTQAAMAAHTPFDVELEGLSGPQGLLRAIELMGERMRDCQSTGSPPWQSVVPR